MEAEAPKDGSRDRASEQPSIPPIKDRIHAASTIDPETGCWNWRRYKDKDGYGNIRLNTKLLRAHRASYEAFVGPILPGLTIDHLCRNTSCVNPQHLEPVTRHENLMRSNAPAAINAAKTHCLKGHICPAEISISILPVAGFAGHA
jgi:hypothetical protein